MIFSCKRNKVGANNAINSDVQKRRFALLLHAGYGGRYAPKHFPQTQHIKHSMSGRSLSSKPFKSSAVYSASVSKLERLQSPPPPQSESNRNLPILALLQFGQWCISSSCGTTHHSSRPPSSAPEFTR
jgi:hypothetical protein